MPDAMDHVQESNAAHAEEALKRHAARSAHAGRELCANPDCEEPISPLRRAHGAQFCLPCQRAEEAQAAHVRVWGRR